MHTTGECQNSHTLSTPSFLEPNIFQSSPFPPPSFWFNRLGRLGNAEAFKKIVANSKNLKIAITSYEQVSWGKKVTELFIFAG